MTLNCFSSSGNIALLCSTRRPTCMGFNSLCVWVVLQYRNKLGSPIRFLSVLNLMYRVLDYFGGYMYMNVYIL